MHGNKIEITNEFQSENILYRNQTHTKKQGRIHGYPNHVRVGRSIIRGQKSIWAGAVRLKTAKTPNK